MLTRLSIMTHFCFDRPQTEIYTKNRRKKNRLDTCAVWNTKKKITKKRYKDSKLKIKTSIPQKKELHN